MFYFRKFRLDVKYVDPRSCTVFYPNQDLTRLLITQMHRGVKAKGLYALLNI